MTDLRKWFSLVRFSHTLFALPFALAGLLVASSGRPGWKPLLLVLACMATARNAAMAFNRFIDRDHDAANPRTAVRDIPAGRISPRGALLFVVVNSLLFVGLCGLLNSLCLMLSPVALVLILGYSLAKRFTALCHLWLGLSIGISPLAAGIAFSGHFLAVPAWLGAALWAWLAGFDIVYATQDEGFDRDRGLHSIPALLGRRRALGVAALFHAMTIAGLIGAGVAAHWGVVWWASVVACGGLLLWTHLGRVDDDLSMQSGFFRANILLSFVVLVGVAISVWF
jgi:4-hydroxybenzoate polyprenyltransferase